MEKQRWGMSLVEWASARSRLEAVLAEAAAARSTVTYSEAALRAFGGRFSARSGALMALLGEVDTLWGDERGIRIATLVVRKDTGRPGEGYFAFIEDETGAPVADREALWLVEANAVWVAFGAGASE